MQDTSRSIVAKVQYTITDITPTVPNGSNKKILANWPNDKHIICTINNDIPLRSQVIHTYWLTEVYSVIAVLRQKITSYWNLELHVIILIQN